MTVSELQVLIALCETAPLIQNAKTAERLLAQLSPYLLEASTQVIIPSPFLRSLEPSPWESLGFKLTRAVLSIGLRHPLLHDDAFETTKGYLKNCLHTVNAMLGERRPSEASDDDLDIEETLSTATVMVSLLGFLDALSLYAHFYSASEMYNLVGLLRQIIDENLMVSVEGVFSSIRTSENSSVSLADWRSYTKRYAASGRPLGAMLLQLGLMRFLVSCSSLQVTTAEQLQNADTFDTIMSDEQYPTQDNGGIGVALLEVVSDIAIDSMRLLEDGSDYLQLGSAWQQRIAFAVKAHTLHTSLNCMVVDEDTADVDMIMTWLEDTMTDPNQMADEILSYVVLQSMAVVAKFSPSIATALGRSLPRFVVQGGIRGESLVTAARSLTYILQRLSQDAVITGLYSLGNVLSARSATDRAVTNPELCNGNVNSSKSTGQYTQHSTSSAISLDLTNEEETAAAYGNVVRAIVSITNSCQDTRITALAQSMLLQKLGRVSLAVDLHIINEVAKLAIAGGQAEFKSLLKLYARLGHEASEEGNSNLAESVRS